MTNQIITFGCRLNAYESEVIRKNMDDSGEQNVIVFNTCAVTAEAERQARQAIRKARRANPDARIVVTGCSAQIDPAKYQAMPEVNLILGNEEKLKPFNFSTNTEKVLVNDIMSVKETALHMVNSFDGKTRAFVQVQNGCNHRCTFCIIPYGRGNSRSVPAGEVVSQIRNLVEQGFSEIVLTGVDISDYGSDLPGTPSLGNLVKRILKLIPELKRLRISSIDAVEVDDDLYDVIATENRLLPHMHISIQSGDDMVLKRMKRRHLRHHIIEYCEKVRILRPDMVFGADIIAGFPTETEEMFQNTLNLVDEVGLTYLHVFPYSERSGTPAARMPQVAKNIRKERAEKLRAAGEKQLQKFLTSRINMQEEILIENPGIGRTRHFAEVKLDKAIESGRIISARIINADSRFLYA